MDISEGFAKALGLTNGEENESSIKVECAHKIKRSMYWPDGGNSEVCATCLKTRHIWEQGETEWQNHEYKSIIDWYKEAVSLQHSMDKI